MIEKEYQYKLEILKLENDAKIAANLLKQQEADLLAAQAAAAVAVAAAAVAAAKSNALTQAANVLQNAADNGGDAVAAQAAAQAAFPAWADAPPLRRARVMFKFLELLHQDPETFSRPGTAHDAAGNVDLATDVTTIPDDQVRSATE